MRRYGPPSEDTDEAERRGITMQHTVGALLLSTFFGISAFAAPPPPDAPPASAIVRLMSPRQEVCGTGFIDDNGYIVTNAHLIRSLCPEGDCSGMVVGSAPALGAAPIPRALTALPRIKAVFPAFDLGFIDAQLPPSTFRSGGPAQAGDEVTALGFPGCASLEYASGIITSVDPLHLTTTLRGGHGSSGSPIVNIKGEVVGIVDEAARFIDSLGAGPFLLRGARIDGTAPPELPQLLPLQLDRLAAFRLALTDRAITDRIRGTFDLMVALEGVIRVARELPPNDPVAAVLSRGDAILSTPPSIVTDSSTLLAESLTVEYALQHRLSVRAPGALAHYTAALDKQGRNTAHLYPAPRVPTMFDLQFILLVGLALSLIGGTYFFVRLSGTFWRRARTKADR